MSKPGKRNRILTAGLFGVLALAVACSRTSQPPLPEGGPRLVLVLVVDQLRYDYLVRFRPLYQAGLERILADGLVFSNAHYEHAATATAPGHATLVTGRHPSHTGIVGNGWYDVEEQREVYSVRDPRQGRSPGNLLGTAFPDWLKERSPDSRAVSASIKDRSAVLLGGHSADLALWLDRATGRFATSRYYGSEPPEWLADFHQQGFPETFFGTAWNPLPLDWQSLDGMGIGRADEGLFQRQFPYNMGRGIAPGPSFYGAFAGTPFADRYLLELARAIVKGELLGQDEAPDYLAVSLSVLDSVGHEFGPNSPEILDVLLRLDVALGEFLGFLDEEVGAGNVLIALSADHGVPAIPEYESGEEGQGRRFDWQDAICIQQAGLAIEKRFGLEDWILAGFYLDRDAVSEAGVSLEEVVEALAQELEGCSVVQKAWTRQELESTSESEEPYFERFRNSHHPERSADLTIQLAKGVVPTEGMGTTHGSVYEYDTHIPFIVVVPGIGGRRIEEPVSAVDLAPTLASFLGLEAPAGLDGIDRSGLSASSTE